MTAVPEDPRHRHDRRYSQLDHHHDRRYYTESEVDDLIENHTHPSRATGEWSYSTNTTIADPGNGNLRSSADNQTIAIAEIDDIGYDFANVFGMLVAGDQIRTQEAADAGRWARYEIVTATDMGNWWQMDLAVIDSSNAGPPNNNRNVLVQFVYGIGGDDGGDQGYVRRGGDTMTGLLTLSGDPTAALHAATKQYVDTKQFVFESNERWARTLNTGTAQVVNRYTFTPPPGYTTMKGYASSGLLLGGASSGSAFQAMMRVDGANYGYRARMTGNNAHVSLTCHGVFSWPANQGPVVFETVAWRESGTGSAATYADPNYNKLNIYGYLL